MTKKKISANDFNYIWEPSETHRKRDWSRTYTMEKLDNGSYHFVETIKTWLFILLYIPEVLLTFFVCLWDGGLREFVLPDFPQQVWKLNIHDKQYIKDHLERADKIWKLISES